VNVKKKTAGRQARPGKAKGVKHKGKTRSTKKRATSLKKTSLERTKQGQRRKSPSKASPPSSKKFSIARIMGQGQYRLDEQTVSELNDIDNAMFG
jgi:hypothetical protein